MGTRANEGSPADLSYWSPSLATPSEEASVIVTPTKRREVNDG